MTTTIAAPDPTGWSKSSLGTLLDICAHRWALTKSGTVADDGSPQAAAGTAYHAAVEARERARMTTRRTGAPFAFDAEWMCAVGYEVLSYELDKLGPAPLGLADGEQADMDTWFPKVEAAILNWHEGFAPIVDRWVPYARELPVNVTPPGRPSMRGYIDGIYWDPDGFTDDDGTVWPAGYVTVDDKSAGGWGRWPHDGAGHELEGTIYTWAGTLSPATPTPSRMEWHVVRTSQSNHGAFQPIRRIVRDFSDQEWVDLAAGQIDEAQRMVDGTLYPANPTSNLCSQKWCPAFQPCQVDGTLSPGAVTWVRS